MVRMRHYLFLLCVWAPPLVEAQIFFNWTVPYAHFLDGALDALGTTGCGTEVRALVDAARRGEDGALRMLDASGKPSSGVLDGAVNFLGSYSECTSVRGTYCLVHLTAHTPQVSRPPTLGFCAPNACTKEDVETALNRSASVLDSSATVSVCHGDPTGLQKDVGALLTLCFFGAVLLLTVVATYCDMATVVKWTPGDPAASTADLCGDGATRVESVWRRCLLAFSLRANGRRLLSREGGGDFTAIHGIRFLSLVFIVFGHTLSFASTNLFTDNGGMVQNASKSFWTQFLVNGTLAVDTFYLISGLLVSYSTLRILEARNGRLPYLHFCLHRYLRLTPAMGAVILFSAYLLRYCSSGPNWLAAIQLFDSYCRENGWLNILYLHNFINTTHMCLSHSWYLATDMQMFIFSPLISIPFYRGLKYGAVSMTTFLLTSVAVTAGITAAYHYPAMPYMSNIVPLDVMDAYYRDVYIKPYCRMGPYIVGMALGYFIHHKKELHVRKGVQVVLWLSSVALGLTLVYLMWPANSGIPPTNIEAAAYSALARPLWAVALTWPLMACRYGHAGTLNSMLSWQLLVPLSRLSYCAYLVHPVVINAFYGSVQTTVRLTTGVMAYAFLGHLCLTFMTSLVISLLFESPVSALEKALKPQK